MGRFRILAGQRENRDHGFGNLIKSGDLSDIGYLRDIKSGAGGIG